MEVGIDIIMRICFLEGDMSRAGGTERMATLLANEFVKKHEVYILSSQFQKGQVFYKLDEDVNHIPMPVSNGKTGILKQINFIHHFIKLEKIDRIINVDIGMGFYGILATKGTNAKVITWEHANYYNNWESKIFPYFRKFAAKYSDALVVLTERDKENYKTHIKTNVPIYVIPNPVSKHEFEYDIHSKIILSAGQLLPIKGYDKAIQIAAKVLKKYPDWKWVICGEGPERQHLEQMIHQAGLENNVILPGAVKDMNKQYQQAAMFVLTSKMEGLPMVLLEAMAWGLPLISFDIMTGPSDIIIDEINGYLIEPDDTNAMADKIMNLINDERLRNQLSKQSQIQMDKFSLASIVDKWKKII